MPNLYQPMSKVEIKPLIKKLKIVVLGTRGFPHVQGGVETHCERLYPFLAAQGNQVIVFTRKSYIEHPKQFYKGVELIHISSPQNKFLEAIVHSVKCIFIAKSLKPDIVHIHAIGPSIVSPLAKLLGLKVVLTHHGADYQREKWKGFPSHFLRFCERIGILFADRIITIAPYIATHIQSTYGKKPVMIPNGVKISARVNTQDTLRAFNLTPKNYFLTVGRFVPEKCFHTLIEAFLLYRAQSGPASPWKLVIVGDCDHQDKYSEKLKRMAQQHPDIILTGKLPTSPLQELYQHCGIFVLPSSYEGLPIVLLEAMSFGAFCLASDIPANRCVNLDPRHYFPPGNSQELFEKMRENSLRIISNDERKHTINHVKKNYNWEDIAQQTLEVYESAV